jgi:hypothetical protein
LNRIQARACSDGLQEREALQQELLELLEDVGPDEFTRLLVVSSGASACEFSPDPRSYPELAQSLEKVKSRGCPIDDLKVSRVGLFWKPQRLRIELPLDADLKSYLPAMQAWQEYFRSQKDPDALVRYLADEHGQGRTYTDLASELTGAIQDWADGRVSPLYHLLDLDGFLRRKGYTPEQYDTYDHERMRRLVRYFWDRK